MFYIYFSVQHMKMPHIVLNMHNYGYNNIGGSVVIKWDNNILQVSNTNQPEREYWCSKGGIHNGQQNACHACYWGFNPCSLSCQCKGSGGNPHNLVGYCDRCRQDDIGKNTVLANTVHNVAYDLRGTDSEFDFTYQGVIMDTPNANVYSYEHIISTIGGNVSISEDELYGFPYSSEDSSSDETYDDECICRQLLRWLTMSENDLTYGVNDGMY